MNHKKMMNFHNNKQIIKKIKTEEEQVLQF